MSNERISIIGLGQIGQMKDVIFSENEFDVSGIGRQDSAHGILGSDVVFVAVDRRGLIDVMEELNVTLNGEEKQPIVVLCQNGILAMDTEVNPHLWLGANLVRESIYTPVVRDDEQQIVFDRDKLRASIAQISGDGAGKVAAVLERSGMKTEICDSYESMEITKLLLNTMGTTGVVTGMNLEETFADERMFEMEVRAIRERLALIKAADLQLYNFWKLSIPARLLGGIFKYTPIPVLKPMRGFLGKLIGGSRRKQLSAAANQVNAGLLPKELDFYHQPFVDLAKQFGLEATVDHAILEIVKEKFKDLGQMPREERVLLLDSLYA